MTTTTDTERYLDHDQLARAEALWEARTALAPRGTGYGAVDAMDLVHVASFILDGCDPWDDPPATPATLAAMIPPGTSLRTTEELKDPEGR